LENHMNASTRNRRSTSIKNANRRVSDSITNLLIEKINNLPDRGFKTTYLKEVFLSKFVSDDTDPAVVRRQRAIDKWLLTEERNADTNARLEHLPWAFNILPGVEFSTFVSFVRKFIETSIGELPHPDVLIGSFSGGASTSRNRAKSHPALKFVGKAHVTPAALGWWEEISSAGFATGGGYSLEDQQQPGFVAGRRQGPTPPTVLHWPSRLRVEEVRGNVLFTVPKKSDIDRCACKEPDINMFMQKGVGDFFRRCLLTRGIDLNDQSKNQRLARIGSIDDSLATLDLSSASDSVTRGLVELLLPPFWFTLLDSLRSPVTLIDGREHTNEMFSSMGNGFTFELESLLFFSIAMAVRHFRRISGIISIYGDDIICPSEMAHDLGFVLGVFGFSLNQDKSYVSGPFRESCGGHYLNGLDVTPFYIREPIRYLTDLIDVANQLRQWAVVSESLDILDPQVEEIWLWLRDMVPEYLWGGFDCSFKFSLVTPHEPRKRLQAVECKSSTGNGGYFHWLSSTRSRVEPSDGVETSERSKELEIYRLRSARHTVTSIPRVFLAEIRG
jgi:hypothetical protein